MKNKGFLNRMSSNIINKHYSDNQAKLWNSLQGEEDIPSLEYLLNFQFQNLSTTKSLVTYNKSGLALEINESSRENEIIDENTIFLSPSKSSVKISTILDKRHSVRQYEKHTMSFKDFSSIIHYSFGVKSVTELNGKVIYQRYHSSSGGLYPIDVYIFVNEVENIPSGVYKYQPISNSLMLTSELSINEFSKVFANNVIDIVNSNFVVCFANSFEKIYLKYGELSLALLFLETGIMAQNCHLNAVARKIGSCDIGGFDKRALEHYLGLTNTTDNILYCLSLGKERNDF